MIKTLSLDLMPEFFLGMCACRCPMLKLRRGLRKKSKPELRVESRSFKFCMTSVESQLHDDGRHVHIDLDALMR